MINYIRRKLENYRIKRNLKQAIKEVRLYKEGKIELQTWQEFLNSKKINKTISTAQRFKEALKKLSRN